MSLFSDEEIIRLGEGGHELDIGYSEEGKVMWYTGDCRKTGETEETSDDDEKEEEGGLPGDLTTLKALLRRTPLPQIRKMLEERALPLRRNEHRNQMITRLHASRVVDIKIPRLTLTFYDEKSRKDCTYDFDPKDPQTPWGYAAERIQTETKEKKWYGLRERQPGSQNGDINVKGVLFSRGLWMTTTRDEAGIDVGKKRLVLYKLDL